MNALSELMIQDTKGQAIRIQELWAERPAVLFFLRHFGCLFCQADLALACRESEKVSALGGTLYLIGNGTPRMGLEFQQLNALKIQVYVDPSLEAYRAADFKRGLRQTLGPRSILKGTQAFFSGFRQSKLQGDPWQQGGVLVVATDGQILYSFASRFAGDAPPMDEVLHALEGHRTLKSRV